MSITVVWESGNGKMCTVADVMAQCFCDIKLYIFQIQYLRIKFNEIPRITVNKSGKKNTKK